MTDPVTVGALATSPLAMAAPEALKTGVGEAFKDAYAKLKTKIAGWAGADVEALAKEPESPGRQLIVAETIVRQSRADIAEVRTLALALNEALSEAARSSAIGVDIGRLEAARVHLQEINVSEGVGFRVSEVKTPGDFTVGKIDVGKSKR
ncbi:MAG TPA: hypothetical protein VKA12_13275 [Roseiarcus sp.]|nr:hypothetical protein [Roseiarcus sp.]